MRRRDAVHDDELVAQNQLERASDHFLRPFQQFAQRRASGGVLLLACVAAALFWANSPWAATYEHLRHGELGVTFGTYELSFDLHGWINDGLMTFFFFAVGLEIKRELLVGDLARPRQALLPIAAAVGGMLVPAAIYAALNASGEGAGGWGIPMATDIAFAIGALTLLGTRVPHALKVFLVALAIVDDLGALLVIAIFYTSSLDWGGVAVAAVFLGALVVANRAGARRGPVYVVLAIGVWYGLLTSGVHATLAGVLTAVCVPVRVRIVPGVLATVIRRSARAIEATVANGSGRPMDPEHFASLSVLRRTLESAMSPLQRFEHIVQPWVTFAVLPVFALVNAGVAIDASTIPTLGTAVPLGIVAGLVIGKPLGICLASWLAVRSGLASLPDGVTWRHVIGTGFLAGIGFTMALFITGLSFPGSPLESEARLGILVASLLAAVVGTAILRASSPSHDPGGVGATGRKADPGPPA